MSDAARWMIAFAFISLPTIAFGGYFLLSILKRQAGTENVTSEQRDYFRAGHAHAGVLVLLAIMGQLVLDESRFSESITWALRIGLVAAPSGEALNGVSFYLLLVLFLGSLWNKKPNYV